MYKKILTLFASAVMLLTAGQAVAQSGPTPEQIRSLTESSYFNRIYGLNNITSGDKYLIEYTTGNNQGVIMDGNGFSNTQSVTLLNSYNQIVADPVHAFMFTAKGNNTFSLKGAGNDTYLNLGNGQITAGEGNFQFTYSDDPIWGYSASVNGTTTYLRYNNGVFSGVSNPATTPYIYLYKQDKSLEYSQKECSVTYGSSSYLLPTLRKAQADMQCTFSSSNTNVATINGSGQVTIKATGYTIISATASTNSNIRSGYVLYVVGERQQGRISMNPTSPFAIGQDITSSLNVSTNSNGAVTYTSSNPNVLLVSADGRTVIAVDEGIATLTAHVAESYAYTAATSDPVSITVSGRYPRETGKSIFYRIIGMSELDDGANYYIAWQENNESIDACVLDRYNPYHQDVSVVNHQISFVRKSSPILYWTITKNGDYYQIFHQGTKSWYLPYNTNNFYSAEQNSSLKTGNGRFTIYRAGYKSYAHYDNHKFSPAIVNSDNDIPNDELCLYKQVWLSYENSRVEVLKNQVNTFTGQTLEKSHASLPVTFSSSNTALARVNASTGVVTITPGIYGRSVITATYHGNNLSGDVNVCYVLSVKENAGTISGSDVTLPTEGVQKLAVTTNSDGTISYVSSNPNVASVDENGNVTGVNVGTATITIRVAESQKYTGASTTISVKVNPISPNLVYTAANTTILVDNVLQPTISYRGTGEITYKSSNENVAKVDADGKVIGVAVGTAKITASVKADGNYTAETKSFDVTVQKHTVDMTTPLSNEKMAVGEVLSLAVKTQSTGNKVFRTSNADVATVSNKGVITAVGPGTATIYYKAEANDKYNAIAEKSISVSVKHNMPVKVNPSALVVAVGASKTFDIQIPQGYKGDYTVTIQQDGSVATVSASGTTRTVTGINPGSATIHMVFDETDTYYGGTIDIPVTVLGIYQYQLAVVNAPSHGVSITICGVIYNEPCTFNSSHSSITVADVVVKPVPGFTSSVSVAENTITVSYTLLTPKKGTFVRLRNYANNKYASMPAADNMAMVMEETGMGNILYYDASGHLLFYQNGQYVSYTNQMASVSNATDASIFNFINGTSTDLYKECFKVRNGTSTSYLHGGSSQTSVGNGNDPSAYWYVESMSELPVTLSSNGMGYGTLYCPVPLEVPGGVEAYYISSKNNVGPGSSNVEHTLTLSPIASVIPANTPVVLIGVPGMTYYFGLKYGASATSVLSISDIKGNIAAQVTTALANGGSVFALQPNSAQHRVDFYSYSQPNTKGFKAYFVESVKTGAACYRLVFEGDESTDILQLEAIEAQETIYDLCGRSVGDSVESLPRGIYVRAGRKFVVK